jgi:AbrB family looped-hinge helix DNA binding protein
MTQNGTIVLPKTMRDQHGFATGTEFEVIDGERDIVLKPVEPAEAKPAETERKLTIAEFISRIPRIDEKVEITDAMIRQAIDAEAIRKWDEENSR